MEGVALQWRAVKENCSTNGEAVEEWQEHEGGREWQEYCKPQYFSVHLFYTAFTLA